MTEERTSKGKGIRNALLSILVGASLMGFAWYHSNQHDYDVQRNVKNLYTNPKYAQELKNEREKKEAENVIVQEDKKSDSTEVYSSAPKTTQTEATQDTDKNTDAENAQNDRIQSEIETYISFPASKAEIKDGKVTIADGDNNPYLILRLDCNSDNLGAILDLNDDKADMCITKETWKDYASGERSMLELATGKKRKEVVYVFSDNEFRKENPDFCIKGSAGLSYNGCYIDSQKIDGLYVTALQVTRDISGNSSTLENVVEAGWEYSK